MIRKKRAQAIIIDQGKILMVRHFDVYIREEYWCLPGGAVEPGELPEQAVVRELKEETGLDVRVLDCIGEYILDRVDHGYTAAVTFLVEIVTGELKLGFDPEQAGWNVKFLQEVRWLPIEGELLSRLDKFFLKQQRH